MDNYVLRLRPEAVRKLIDALRIRFNSPVRCTGKFYSWDTVIRLKAQELAQYILGKKAELDFAEPKPALRRTDSEAIRGHILSITAIEGVGVASRGVLCGICKSVLGSTDRSRSTAK